MRGAEGRETVADVRSPPSAEAAPPETAACPSGWLVCPAPLRFSKVFPGVGALFMQSSAPGYCMWLWVRACGERGRRGCVYCSCPGRAAFSCDGRTTRGLPLAALSLVPSRPPFGVWRVALAARRQSVALSSGDGERAARRPGWLGGGAGGGEGG